MRVAYLPTFALISLCVFLVNKSVEKQKADIVFLPKIIVWVVGSSITTRLQFLPELLEYPHLLTQADFYDP